MTSSLSESCIGRTGNLFERACAAGVRSGSSLSESNIREDTYMQSEVEECDESENDEAIKIVRN